MDYIKEQTVLKESVHSSDPSKINKKESIHGRSVERLLHCDDFSKALDLFGSVTAKSYHNW